MNQLCVLLSALETKGIHLVPEGQNLRVKPASDVSREDLEVLRVHKLEILTLLKQEAEGVLGKTEEAIQAMFKDGAWRQAWAQRFERNSSDATIRNVHNGVEACMKVARSYCEKGDPRSTRSACALAMKCATGELYESDRNARRDVGKGEMQ